MTISAFDDCWKTEARAKEIAIAYARSADGSAWRFDKLTVGGGVIDGRTRILGTIDALDQIAAADKGPRGASAYRRADELIQMGLAELEAMKHPAKPKPKRSTLGERSAARQGRSAAARVALRRKLLGRSDPERAPAERPVVRWVPVQRERRPVITYDTDGVLMADGVRAGPPKGWKFPPPPPDDLPRKSARDNDSYTVNLYVGPPAAGDDLPTLAPPGTKKAVGGGWVAVGDPTEDAEQPLVTGGASPQMNSTRKPRPRPRRRK